MRFIASLMAIGMSVLGVVPAYAGNVCSTSRCVAPVRVANTYVAPNYNVVQKVTDIQFVPTFVSFVPSQVLLNGQVTTYGGYSGVGYSYQGPVAQPQQPQPQPQPDQGQVDPNPVNVQSADASRLDRIEKMLEQLMNGNTNTGDGGSVNTKEVNPQTVPEVKGVKDYDAVQFLSTKCVKCHTPGGSGSEEKSKNGYTFFNADGTLKDKLNRMRIYESIDSGAMPKGGTTDPHTREAVRLWLQAGLKDLAY